MLGSNATRWAPAPLGSLLISCFYSHLLLFMAEIRRKTGGFIWEQMDDSLAEQVRWEIHTAGGDVKISCSNWFSSQTLNPNMGWNVLALLLHVSLSVWQPRDRILGHAGGIFSLAHAGAQSAHSSGDCLLLRSESSPFGAAFSFPMTIPTVCCLLERISQYFWIKIHHHL